MKYNNKGEELPDDTPVEVPLHFKRPMSLQEQIRQMVRVSMSQAAGHGGAETFEEADDFDVDDDDDLHSPHELDDDQELVMQELREFRRMSPAQREELLKYSRAQAEAKAAEKKEDEKPPSSDMERKTDSKTGS